MCWYSLYDVCLHWLWFKWTKLTQSDCYVNFLLNYEVTFPHNITNKRTNIAIETTFVSQILTMKRNSSTPSHLPGDVFADNEGKLILLWTLFSWWSSYNNTVTHFTLATCSKMHQHVCAECMNAEKNAPAFKTLIHID